MLVRKNTKAFKTIVDIVKACQGRKDREKLIRLYITKAGHTIRDRISVEGIQGEAGLFYEMGYQNVLNNLQSSNHQLQVSDEVPGLYFFHSTSNKIWDETPFEFDEAIKKEFASLPELPAVRKKEKVERYDLSTTQTQASTPAGHREKKEQKEKKREGKILQKQEEAGPRQPDYKLRHQLYFTNLDKIIFRQSKLTKKDVLDYYSKISDYLLPYLKDRKISLRLHADLGPGAIVTDIDSLFKNDVERMPGWISKSKKEEVVLCNDKEHVLLYTEMGCVQFNAGLSRMRALDSPDYMIIGIDSPESSLGKAIDAAHVAKVIFNALQLPSFIKTDGVSGLHIYLPLDGKDTFETAHTVAMYLCKLIKLKIPDVVTLKGSDDYVYGKVSLDYSLNEGDGHVVAPYSLIPGLVGIVAAPLLWEEVKEGLRIEDFTYDSIFRRLKESGDPFESLFKKRVSAASLLDRLEEHYAFLF